MTRFAAGRHMKSEKSTLLRMDNVGVVVESLDEAITFFTELGLLLEGRAMVEGEWAGASPDSTISVSRSP